MKTELSIQVRAFPVVVEDQRNGERAGDTIVLTKEQLQAAQLVGQSSKELIYRIYNRQGFKVLEIGSPAKRGIIVNLGELYRLRKEERSFVL